MMSSGGPMALAVGLFLWACEFVKGYRLVWEREQGH